MFVGEQPGHEEDLAGVPFIGPAGLLFDSALAEAGIDRSIAFVTNTVKHFKWKPKGKRRLHEKAKASEIEACLPWLAAEIEVVKPRILVLFGATAAQPLLGNDFRVARHNEGFGLIRRSQEKCSQRYIHRPFCVHRAPREHRHMRHL